MLSLYGLGFLTDRYCQLQRLLHFGRNKCLLLLPKIPSSVTNYLLLDQSDTVTPLSLEVTD